MIRDLVLSIVQRTNPANSVILGITSDLTLDVLAKITPTSIKLKSNIRNYKPKYIIQRVEKQLIQECIRTVNNTIYVCGCNKEKCKEQFTKILDHNTYQLCEELITLQKLITKSFRMAKNQV